jgi:hypothetical protein
MLHAQQKNEKGLREALVEEITWQERKHVLLPNNPLWL